MIKVSVNQKNHQFKENTSLEKLIEDLKIQTRGIAIALNNNVIKKSDWSVTRLKNHDNILIVKSTQGG